MKIYTGDKAAAEYELVSDREVNRADFMTTYIRMIKNLFDMIDGRNPR